MKEESLKPAFKLVEDLIVELANDSDRTVAVTISAHIDHLLKFLIAKSAVVEEKEVLNLLLNGGQAPLSSFASRTNIAYCMGWISRAEKEDIDRLRYVRNGFAHRLTGISFSLPGISEKCLELDASRIGGQPLTPRECYVKAGFRYIVILIDRIQEKIQQPDEIVALFNSEEGEDV